jgi:putative Holliday junction resolvase
MKKSLPKYNNATAAANAITEIARLTALSVVRIGVSNTAKAEVRPVGFCYQFRTLYNPRLAERMRNDGTGRVLALDVGKKRIGLAVSDELGYTAQGIETLVRTRVRDDLAALQQIAAQWNVHTLLVGKPLHMSGAESRQSEYTREFAERLSKHLTLPLVYWDERLTSKEAERLMREGGANVTQSRQAVDRMSAVLILESYLGFLENQKLSEFRPDAGEFVG